MRRATGATLLFLLLPLAAPFAVAGDSDLGCGNLAPFGTSCFSGPRAWPEGGDLVVSTLGFVGTLEARLEWTEGAFVKTCASNGLSYSYPLPLVPCDDNGTLPAAGTDVVLRCIAEPHPTLPRFPPAGSWACKAEAVP